MPRPIDTMLKKVDFRCLKCGAVTGTCDCWEKIKLECPDCGKQAAADRERSDPPGTALVKARCPDCDDGGGFPDILYFDAAGRQITDF